MLQRPSGNRRRVLCLVPSFWITGDQGAVRTTLSSSLHSAALKTTLHSPNPTGVPWPTQSSAFFRAPRKCDHHAFQSPCQAEVFRKRQGHRVKGDCPSPSLWPPKLSVLEYAKPPWWKYLPQTCLQLDLPAAQFQGQRVPSPCPQTQSRFFWASRTHRPLCLSAQEIALSVCSRCR